MHNTTTISLPDQLRNMNESMFDKIYTTYYPSMLAYAELFVSKEDAKEIVQDIMIWFWEKRKTLTIQTTLKGYLFRSVKNNCLLKISQEERQQRLQQAIYDRLKIIYEDVDFYTSKELSEKIAEALNALPETYRYAFEQNRFENKTYQEIATELNVSVKTVDYRISQALKLLRVQLKDYLVLFILLRL